MINILQNVTKDKINQEATRLGIGVVIVAPFVILGLIINYAVSNNYVNGQALYIIAQSCLVMFMLWSVGGAYQAWRRYKSYQVEADMRKTDSAFEKLANGKH